MKLPVHASDILFVLAGITMLTVFGVTREHRQMHRMDSYSSYDARMGGYRAWYEMLRGEGVNVTRFERYWAFLDSSTSVLIITLPVEPADVSIATPSGQKALSEWVRGGGTLLILGAFIPTDNSPFKKLHYHTWPRKQFLAIGVHRIVSSALPTVQEATIGQGKVLRIEDETLFVNEHIGVADTARFAYALGLPPAGGVTAFDETLHGWLIPEHWWQVAPHRLVWAILIASIVLLIAFLGATVRLGPAISPLDHRAAHSAEYLDAVASLYARANARRKVLGDVVNAVKHAVLRSSSLPADAHAVFMELDKLVGDPKLGEEAFVRGVASAQRLREEVVGSGARGT